MAKSKTTQKKSSKKGSSRPFIGIKIPGDPPIIVGGGGSTLVWIKTSVFRKELTAAEVTTMLAAHPHVPQPTTPGLYRVFDCNFNAGAATVKSDDTVRSVKHNDMDTDRHHTVFHQA